jgi:hypothetical protein
MTVLADHLWQSLLFVALVALLVRLTRANAAVWRLWMWRVAAFKLLLPFALLSSLGAWFGFPSNFSGDPPPAPLVKLVNLAAPWFSTGGWFETMAVKALVYTSLLLATVATALVIFWNIHAESRRAAIERYRLEVSPDDREPNPGFFSAALISACPLIVLCAPLLGGMVRGGVHAHEVLTANTLNMNEARVTIRPAKPGLGSRYFVDVDANGVSIRNTSLRELAAMAYGVSRFFVRGIHFREADQEDWLIDTRYDVRVDSLILEPDNFDTYALRPAITRELATNFGLEIYVNKSCQKPCGKWDGKVLMQVAPDSWALVDAKDALDADPSMPQAREATRPAD